MPTQPRPSARPLPQTPEDMKAWSLALSNELAGWPGVVRKSMFGMRAFYRRDSIFACLPEKRAFYSPNTVIFKLDPLPPDLAERARRDTRINGGRAFERQRGWLSFELGSAEDIPDVLWWFTQAHRAAGSHRRTAGA